MAKDQLLTLASASSNALSANMASERTPVPLAGQLATRLFGFYRASEANDPEAFIAGATVILAQYPEPVVRALCHPTGLPASNKWLPSLAELREAADERMKPIKAEQERAARRAATDKIVNGEPVTRAERERVAAGFRRLRGEMWPEAKPESYEARLARLAGRYAAEAPRVNTTDMGNYLERMRDQLSVEMEAD